MTAGDLATRLLAWYDRHRRDLPWRAAPGSRKPAYHVWLSEIMLQQTTVATVKPYYQAFLKRWPTVDDLAAAALDDVLHAWQGLGYYARARNLHRCAQTVAQDYGGVFPNNEDGLRDLPGIGPYTAAAVAAIAFGRKATPVDGNIERVIARLRRVETPLPGAKPELRRLAEALTPDDRAGDFAQAMMDLGATICLPKQPVCDRCPWQTDCAAAAAGIAADLPRRMPKKRRPTRHGMVFWLRRPDGAVLLRRRPEDGLLGGLMEFPGTDWRERKWPKRQALALAPTDCRILPGLVEHTFTHFHLRLDVAVGRLDDHGAQPGRWVQVEDFATLALPTLMKKVARHALDAGA